MAWVCHAFFIEISHNFFIFEIYIRHRIILYCQDMTK